MLASNDAKLFALFKFICIHNFCSNVPGAQREMHQMPQMGPREHGQRVSSLWAVGHQRQLHGYGGGSR